MPRILWYLLDGSRRFAELQRDLDGISAKVLAAKLRALEREDIVKRTVHPTTPPQVEYALTQRGRAFAPVFKAMEQAANELFESPVSSPTSGPAAATAGETPVTATPDQAD